MKIEIDIDIESIIIEALKKKEISNIYVPPREVSIPAPRDTPVDSRTKWEYSRRNGRRRTPEELALHELEKEKGRKLTPEEKGETKALVQIDTTAENKAKEDTIKKIRIDGITAEGIAAATKELAEESSHIEEELLSGAYPENPIKYDNDTEEPEATIPKTEKLDTNSIFSR
jgi:hypothetical protein|tara:strand:+ start:56 stop:571 length:516 start_codon:yes stop_codon:yes gene_type:complete